MYPKEFEENARYRAKLVLQATNDPDKQAQLYAMCRQDILFWINCFVYTFNPRKTPAVIPFITWKFQDDLILKLAKAVKEQKDVLVDKSRDMGVTWCVLLVYCWYWQFGDAGFDFLCGSRKEQYVDKIGEMDTLLEKIRFIVKNEPMWMRPTGFSFRDNATFMKLKNPENQNTISGEATNDNFSRGGRRRSIFFDEFAFWDCDDSAWRASADTTNCRIAVSTPCGFNNKFAKLRHGGGIDVTSLHWRLHPEKDQAWYDNECERRNHDKIEISQELDISYEGSEEGILFDWEDMNKAKTPNIALSRERIVVVCDPAMEGDDEAVIYVSNNGSIAQHKVISQTKAEGLAAEIVTLIRYHKAQVFACDAIGNDIITAVRILMGKEPIRIIEFKSSEKSVNPDKFYNKRAEAYYDAAHAMRSGNLQIDDDYTLMKQLNATKYKKKNDRIIIIPKEEIKQIVGGSPDRADAWVLIWQALQATHSRQEVEYKEGYRKRVAFDTKPAHHGYGDWGDVV